MKKIIAFLMAAVMCLSLAACGEQPAPSTTEAPVTTEAPTAVPTQAPTTADPLEGVTAAQKYLRAIYKDAPVKTADDYVLSGVIRIGTDEYPVTWETNTEDAVPTKAEDGKTWTVVVNKSAAADTEYILTGTVEDAAGNKLSVEFPHMLPKGVVITRYDQIVNMAYGLEDGEATKDVFRLCGVISEIPTAWSDEYKNITVNMVVAGLDDKPIQCYRLSGEGAEKLAVGDEIAVFGTIKNYKGTIEFDKGCKLIPVEALADVKTVLDAYQLEDGESFEGLKTLTGTIINIPSAWSDEYQNITVDFVVAGLEEYPMEAYRLSGEGAKDLAVGDTITVTGTLTRYKDTREFGKGCTLDAVVKGE